jgi:outer membrane protein OmpA-like peptidoglycan-associated protein
MTASPRRGFTKAALAAAVAAGFAAFPVAARAQLTNAPIDLQLFRPAMDSKGFITLNSSGTLGMGDVSFGLVTTYARRPLSLTGNVTIPSTPPQPNGNTFSIDHLITPSLQAAVGIAKLPYLGFELGLVLPMSVLSGHGSPNDPPTPGMINSGTSYTFTKQGLGDLEIHPKLRLLNATRKGIGIALIPSIILGTGDKNSFLGEGQTIFQPTAVIDTELGYLGRFRAGVNAGLRIRGHNSQFVDNPQSSFPPNGRLYGATVTNTNAGLIVGNEVLGGLALSYGIVPQKFEVLAEVYGQTGSSSKKIAPDGTQSNLGLAAEAIAGIKLYLAHNSFFEAGGGWSIASGYGTGHPRAFIGFIFEPSIGDRDGDGYKDDVDKCPDDPEDFDDFEDEDGCPDPDNDKDGIPDDVDKCPNDPETKNGYQDEDGCPDSVNTDRDGDGIPDDRDKCPDDPEDKDGFEDEDGCPDPDNDKDGIPDVNDLCPNVPEDKDGFEDQDGCPDPDNDKDGIPDVRDKCPNQPETKNGYQDEDGCPDESPLLKIHRGKIEILDKIYFETDKDEILPRSFPLLDAIAATLKGNPQILLVEIQGHADERGDDAHNLDLTDRRAASVRRALEQRNVEPARLRSHGYGETKPICTQHNEDCWSKNRRVEFIILKRSDEATFKGGEGQ